MCYSASSTRKKYEWKIYKPKYCTFLSFFCPFLCMAELHWLGEMGKNVAHVNMWLKCIDKRQFNSILPCLNRWLKWLRAFRVNQVFSVVLKSNIFFSTPSPFLLLHSQIITSACICFFCTLFLFNFLNFPLVDTVFLLTEFQICYPIKLHYCLSSISSFEVFFFFQSHTHN